MGQPELSLSYNPAAEFCFKIELTQSLTAGNDVKMNQQLAAWSKIHSIIAQERRQGSVSET